MANSSSEIGYVAWELASVLASLGLSEGIGQEEDQAQGRSKYSVTEAYASASPGLQRGSYT